jgi:DNA-binding transcriptional MerR regulator
MGRGYRIGELAALTGVTVRTLHHYDRIGLFRPAAHSEGGHRLYADRDLLDLQQILTLRFLGFKLREIRDLLARPDFDLVVSLRVQQVALRDRVTALERVQTALGELLDHRLSTGCWDWTLAARASATVQEELDQGGDSMENTRARFTPEQMAQFEELGRKVGQEEIKQVQDNWAELIAQVRAARDLDPASPEARALADRWQSLSAEIAAHYRDYPDLLQAIRQNYHENRYSDVPEAPQAEDFAFIQRVQAARGT